MTYLPVNAMSELVIPVKSSGDGFSETTFRFHTASPASCSPALRPTRGSGLGASADFVLSGDGDPVPDELEPAQPSSRATAAAGRSGRNLTRVIGVLEKVFRKRARPPEARRA